MVVPTLPAASVSVAEMTLIIKLAKVTGKAHVPSDATVVVPSTTSPSRTWTVVPASPVPVIVWSSFSTLVPTEPSVATGATVSTLTEPVNVLTVVLPAASWAEITRSAVRFVSPDCTV